MQDILPYGQKEQRQTSSKRAPHHPSFGTPGSAFHHEPVDAGWEYYPVYPGKPGCRSSNARTCPSVGIGGDNLLTIPALARTSVQRSHAPSRVGYFTR